MRAASSLLFLLSFLELLNLSDARAAPFLAVGPLRNPILGKHLIVRGGGRNKKPDSLPSAAFLDSIGAELGTKVRTGCLVDFRIFD